VQGVGFRPFVYRLATDLGLGGCVGNDSHGAFIEVEGPAEAVASFAERLQAELPPIARISHLIATPIPTAGQERFEIETSARGATQDAEITPDVGTCADCLSELLNPADRRYRYPFTNCTNCGPRYSIIRGVPYDRPFTTMAAFRMCPACQAEYDNPADRRFHAQPNACPVCGPRVWLTNSAGIEQAGDPIRKSAELLLAGQIVAIKGLGGFHLACRADRDEPVLTLRSRKGREAKPLALMVDSLETARKIAEFDDAAVEALLSPERPIVLAPRRADASVSVQVAPGHDHLGIMLPYTPVHHLLFAEGLPALVMTSGNPSEEPLCRDNDEALRRLSTLADAFLLHDRDIERRVDDSVVIALEEKIVPLRRARGHAPAPIALKMEVAEPVLALGGELKSTVCVLAGHNAILSEHLGDLSNAPAYRNFVGTIEQFRKLLRVAPAHVACDLHPDYAATRYAPQLGLPITAVQHHHAHIVSCMADNQITGRVLGIACDGTGFGPDRAIWGCELLACDEAGFERVGHLKYFPLLGGDAAAHQTWRPAAGLLSQSFGADWRRAGAFAFQRVSAEVLDVAERQLAHAPVRAPQTSSLGRLFDAVAFLLGVCDLNRYEAEAAMTLESLARQCPDAEALPYAVAEREDGLELDVLPAVGEIMERMQSGDTPAELARRFHETLAAMLSEAAVSAARKACLTRAVLSGGCFLNGLLLERLVERLAAAGLETYTHSRVPPGDGGLSLGQAVVAASRRMH
jgi:hydrogenase maturation protein HypF